MKQRLFLPVMRPQLPPARMLQRYLRRIDARRVYSNWGPLATEFEARLATRLDLPRGTVVSASSGTLALAGAILAATGPARRARPLAIVPAFTFVATAVALAACGYECFVADVDERSWMLDSAALIARLPARVLRRAGIVVPVAPFGRPVPQRPWRHFRRRTGIPVVIDGAAAIEGLLEAPRTHLGDIAVALSLHATKSLGVGEGGCVIVGAGRMAGRITQCLNYGFVDTRESLVAGVNGKMSEYHAAVGLAQLDGWFDRTVAGNRRVEGQYRRALGAAGLADRLVAAPDISSAYVLFRCRDAAEARRVENALWARNIDSRHWYGEGLHGHRHYATSLRERSLAVSERLGREVLGLPIARDMSPADIARVTAGLAAGCRS